MDTIIRLFTGRRTQSLRDHNTNSTTTHGRSSGTAVTVIEPPTVKRTPPIDIPERKARDDLLAIMFPHLVMKKPYIVHPAGLIMESRDVGRRKWEREALEASKRRYEMTMKRQWEMEIREAMRGMDVW
ncbi:MAG: hypothetical protein Q9213_005140 [Squamulea squamosa]